MNFTFDAIRPRRERSRERLSGLVEYGFVMQTAINLFTLRDVEEPLPTVLERVAAAGYDGCEFIHRLPKADVDAVRTTLEETGLDVPAAHLAPFTDLDDVPEAFDETAEIYDAVGCDALVLSIGDHHFETAADVDETARKLDALADRLAEHGFDLLYHNHHWEFTELDGRTRFDRLLEATDERIGVELDVGWAAAGGADPVELIDRLDERLSIVHVKDVDVDTKTSVEAGDGDVDLEACADAAVDVGVDWLVYEHDEPDDPLESLSRGASVLSRLG